jgi:hypothetical protein
VQTTSPSLLGGNIVDQAKNLEILRRRTQWNYQITFH